MHEKSDRRGRRDGLGRRGGGPDSGSTRKRRGSGAVCCSLVAELRRLFIALLD